MAKMVDCPRGCGWANGNPDLDEDGMPYTCFFCGNTGQVDEAAAADDLAAQAETRAWAEDQAYWKHLHEAEMAAAGEFGGYEDEEIHF